MSGRGRVLDVEHVWWEGSDLQDDDRECVICGEGFEPVDDEMNDGAIEVVWEPAPDIHENAIFATHPACAVSNGWHLRWAEES